MKDFLEFIVKGIVKNEDAVEIEESSDADNIINLRLKVAKDDMGLVIGKEGKVIKSIRSLLRAKATKEEKRINLELLDENIQNLS